MRSCIHLEHIMKSIKFLLPLAALALAGAASASVSTSKGDVPSIVVSYGDLDLNSQAGVVRLHKRIRNAARSVCNSLDYRILGLRDAYEDCVAAAISNGVAAVANPNLSNFHASKGKGVILASN
jgi:UrcA family protein